MSASDTAKEVIRIATTAGLAKDVIDLQAAKLDLLVKENTELSTKASTLEIEVHQLRRLLDDRHPIVQPADTCLYCRRAAGEIVDIKPHPYFGEAGAKVGYYKCSYCGKKYDKDLRPDA
jgi:hypothetical protein